MFSIYSSLFNLESLKFPWKESIENWVKFLNGSGEIILVLNKSNDNSEKILSDYIELLNFQYGYLFTKIKIIKTEFEYSNPEFDGQIKNAGYKACTQPITILLDLDEVLALYSQRSWIILARNLLQLNEIDGYIIPSINLCKSWKEYKDIGQKFYMIKNKPYIHRGVVNFARKEDGSIDVSKSDTTEPCMEDGSLIKCIPILPSELPDYMKLSLIKNGACFVFHRGWEFLDHREQINKFWKAHWENRAKHEINDIMLNIDDLKKINTRPHDLLHWDIKE